MKYAIVFITALSVALVSCNRGEKKETTSSDSTEVASAPAQDSAVSPGAGSKPTAMQPKGAIVMYEGNLPPNGTLTRLEMGSNFMYSISETKDGNVTETRGYYNLQRAFEGDPKLTLFSLTDTRTSKQRYFVQHTDRHNELILLDSTKKAIEGENPYKLVKK